jgi:hypothetical protein
VQLFIDKSNMEAIVVTKHQLLEMFDEYKHNSVNEKVSIRVKKFDVLAYSKDQEYQAWIELLPDITKPKHKIVQVTDQQFTELANLYIEKEQQLQADQNISQGYLLQTPLK